MSSSSGGHTPGDVAAPNPLHNTSKYKVYVQAVDRALKTFENPNEWADLISALAKLAKVFQSNAKFGDIPKPVTVAKRLSQCLHPALPMGVHLKALETYRQIFDILGPQSLPKLLYLFAVGLFPLMDHCGIKVKSELFNIFEQYLLPLGHNLKPALPGFLAGVLLGLEEGTEFYERSLSVLDRVCEGVGERAFFACLWQAVLGSPSVRLPAMLYVNAKFDKTRTLDDQIAIVGDHVNHMVAALCAVANDSGSPLVQRNLLDFLCAAFPLDSTNLTSEDFVQLLKRCMFVVLRRDMSLNRRLYTWLMNPTGGTVAISSIAVGDDVVESSFFIDNALPLIVRALTEYLQLDLVEIPQASTNAWAYGWGDKKESELHQFAEVRVCRLLLYLQDRADIGVPVLNKVFALLLIRMASVRETLTQERVLIKDTMNSEVSLDRSSMRLSLELKKSTSSSRIGTLESADEKEKDRDRRLDEISKTFNLLLNSLEPGYLFDFLGSWFRSLIKETPCSDEIAQFARVVVFCLETCNLDGDPALRARFLPTMLCLILGGLHNDEKLVEIETPVLLQVIEVCNRLLAEISQSGTIEARVPNGDISDTSSSASPKKHVTITPTVTGAIDEDQVLMESCVNECLLLFSSVCRIYVANRSNVLLPLLTAVCTLTSQFVDYPLYCFVVHHQSDQVLPEWLQDVLKVVDAPSWIQKLSSSSQVIDASDLSARTAVFELVLSIYLKCVSVLSQHEAIRRRLEGQNSLVDECEESPTTVLLKPLLFTSQLNKLEKDKVFEYCGHAIWLALGLPWCAYEHERLSRLLVLLHSRKPTEPSSDVENIVVSALTTNDTMVSTEAAQTFHRVWMLTRNNDDQPPLSTKPFNRAVMLLLGVLADESVTRARTELKSAAAAWFTDCAKHNDLPRIVQMLATMLMNPVTARISIQYIFQETRLSRDQFSLLPNDVSVVTLVTSDGKQRLYHFDGPVNEGAWQYELKNRLLLSSETGASEMEPTVVSTCTVGGGDIPNFDEDTDSLDTLSISLDGVDSGVVETLQFIIDYIVEDEESELDNQRRLESALASAPPEGESVIFRNDEGSEAETSTASAVTSRTHFENGDRPAQLGGDSVARFKKGHRRQDSLQESIFSMTEKELKTFDTTELLRPSVDSSSEGVSLFHELHVHMLLYGESGRVVDLGRAETAFRILTALLCPRGSPVANRMLLSCLVSSGTAALNGDSGGVSSPLTGSLVDLMAKHVRAILGQHFWGATGDEDVTKHRHLTLLELLITISLHFLRSFFLNSPISPVTEADLVMAWKCKISALDFLSELLSELCGMISEQQSRPFVTFVQSVLSRSKLQKCLLHLLLTAVHDPRASAEPGQTMPLSVSIFEFNEGASSNVRRRLAGLLSAYNRSLLSVTAQAIRLESDIKNGYSTYGDMNTSGVILNRLAVAQHIYNIPPHRGTLRESNPSLVELRAFLLIVLNALKKQPEHHEMWFQFVIEILPWMERSLATVMVRVVEQLCKNIETAVAVCFINNESKNTNDVTNRKSESDHNYPACFITMTLETITTLVHFCVVDTPVSGSAVQTTTPPPVGPTPGGTSMVGQAIAVIPGTKGATELFSNLVKVFSFGDSTSAGGVNLSKLEGSRGSFALRQARNDMLTSLPHALATICDLWTVVRNKEEPLLPLGSPQHLRQLMLDLLSPIAQHHQQAFLTALSLVWLTRSGAGVASSRRIDPDQPNFQYTPAQHDIANLLLSLKVISFEELVTAVSETLKEVGVKATKLGAGEKASFPTEAPLLELVHGCVKALPTVQLRSCWVPFQSLFADAPLANLPPRAIFLLYIILCDYVRCAGASYIVEDKAMSRAVQDAVQRLTEAVNAVVGWQLETTTWLKRTLVVRHDQGVRSQDASPSVEMNTPLNTPLPSMNQSEQNSMRGSTLSLMARPTSLDTGSNAASLPEKRSSSNLRSSVKDTNNNKRDPAHSTQALFLLAENLAELVDSVCKSDDKERLLPTLNAVWGNVVPYLRAKNARNSRFFLASSQLLASMSSFSYMRPVWKKTTLELLLDSSFFKMDMQSLRQWLIVTDHLMTHDKTSFKDLLKSIAYTPNASFSIMTSKEQEYEARAQAVKRLAFVVLGSELDQYQAQMNDIQERLSENLRVSQSPSIRSAVFLCIRVLLLRLRPPSLIGIWPIMVTELVHVLLQMEQQLCAEGNGIEDLGCARDDAWMQLYLAACKLLETLCTLPAGYLAQFQMCHWAFVNSVSTSKTDMFFPFAGRINKLLRTKFGKLTQEELANLSPSLCGMKMLTSFEELRPFFYALATQNKALPGTHEGTGSESAFLAGSLSYKNAVQRLEYALYVDLAEHWQL